MPILDAPLDPVTVASLKGTLDYYLWRGLPVIRSWPRKPKMPRTPAVTQAFETFGQVARLFSQMDATAVQYGIDESNGTLWTWRDLWTAAVYGNLYEYPPEPVPGPELDMPPMQPGRYYGPPLTGAGLTTQSLATGTIRLLPLFVPNQQDFDQLATEVTATTGGTIRLGLYGPLSGDLATTPLILDSGTISVTGTGAQTFAIGISLAPGWYLLAVQTSLTRTFRGFPLANLITLWGSAAAANSVNAQSLSITRAYGPYPNPLGTPTPINNVIPPVLYARTM